MISFYHLYFLSNSFFHFCFQLRPKERNDETSPTNSEASVSNRHDFHRITSELEACTSKQVSSPSRKDTCTNTIARERSDASITVRKTLKSSIEANHTTPAEFSKFNASQLISDYHVKFSTALWESIQSKIVRASFDQVPLLADEIHKIFAEIEKIGTIDLSPLKNMVVDYFEEVKKFKDLESSTFSNKPSNDQIEKIQELELHLQDSMLLEQKADAQIKRLQSDLEEVDEELRSLHSKKVKLESSLKEHEDELAQSRIKTSKIQEDMRLIEASSNPSEDKIKQLDLLQSLLESSRDELKNFKWKP